MYLFWSTSEYKLFVCFLLLGCMAERLKIKLLETDKMVDLVAGPGNECLI